MLENPAVALAARSYALILISFAFNYLHLIAEFQYDYLSMLANNQEELFNTVMSGIKQLLQNFLMTFIFFHYISDWLINYAVSY